MDAFLDLRSNRASYFVKRSKLVLVTLLLIAKHTSILFSVAGGGSSGCA